MPPVRPPVQPMLARLARVLPERDWLYEPKWDGFRCLAFRDGGDVDLRSRHGRPLARYFPEVVEALRGLSPDRVVLDGELLVRRGGSFDFEALMARLHPAASRVARLAAEAPATYVAFDLLGAGDEDLMARPFAERRARLEALLSGAPEPLRLTPATGERGRAEAWLERFAGGGVDGVVAKPADAPYRPGARAMVKVKRERTTDCVVGGYRYWSGRPLVGSLLLGLYDDAGALRHVGVASAFPVARRAELLEELRPLAVDLAGHPWASGWGLEGGAAGRLHGAAARWDPATMARDWVPLAPVRVCEVAHDQLDGLRFRHPARFRRWRPDRDPRSCTIEQLAEPAAPPAELLAA